MQDEPDAQTLVMVRVQTRYEPYTRSMMKVACLLSYVSVFLLLAGAQVLE